MTKTNETGQSEIQNARATWFSKNDLPGAIALTEVHFSFDMKQDPEERLISFIEWQDGVTDRLIVTGLYSNIHSTLITLLWGGKQLKDYATEKALVNTDITGNNEVDTWENASRKIERAMMKDINTAFAMFQLRQCVQGERSFSKWYRKLKSLTKTLCIDDCTCGGGYSKERIIRDLIVELTADSALREEALRKRRSKQDRSPSTV